MKVKLIKEVAKAPDLKKYKIPSQLIDPDYKLYHITLQCSDMNELRKRLYFLPTTHFQRDPSSQIWSNSYRTVPEGKCQIDQCSAFYNNMMMSQPKEKAGSIVRLKTENKDTSDKIVGYPIVYNHQFLGYLLPNSVFDEEYEVVKGHHKGLHLTYGFYRRGLPDDQVQIFSLQPWKEIEKELDKLKIENQSEKQ